MQIVDLALTGVPVVAAGGAGLSATVRQPGNGETAVGSTAFYIGFLAILVIEQTLR